MVGRLHLSPAPQHLISFSLCDFFFKLFSLLKINHPPNSCVPFLFTPSAPPTHTQFFFFNLRPLTPDKVEFKLLK